MRSRGTRLTGFAVAYRALALTLIRQRPFVTLFGAGAVSVLAMAPFHAWPVLFFTLPVLFWALDAEDQADPRPLRTAAWYGWAFGFGYHLVGLHWIGFAFLVQAERFAALMPFAIVGLTAGLGLFFAAAGVAFAWARRHLSGGMPRLVALALVVMASEWLRGHILTGFPWNILGYALTMPLPLMQWVGFFGIYVLTAITVIVLAAPLVVLADDAERPGLIIGATTAAPLILATIYGLWVLSANPTVLDETVRLRIVQPSFTQKEKFIRTMHGEIFNRHLALSTQRFDTTASSKPPTHIIWPEAAIPFFARRSKAALAALSRAFPDDVRVIAGTFRINASPDVPNEKVGPYRVYNSAMVFGGDGRVKSYYDKIHLVPFGEYLPAQPLLRALGFENLTRTSGGLAIGKGPRELMRIAGLPQVEMLICYEASFPGELVQGNERPGVLVNLTNDAWFGNTTGPYQHFHQTRLRAVEQGVAMVRSANNGISAIVDPMGRIVARLGLNKVGVVDGNLPVAKNAPYYARFGRLIEFASALLMLAYLGAASQRRRQ